MVFLLIAIQSSRAAISQSQDEDYITYHNSSQSGQILAQAGQVGPNPSVDTDSDQTEVGGSKTQLGRSTANEGPSYLTCRCQAPGGASMDMVDTGSLRYQCRRNNGGFNGDQVEYSN